MIYLQNTCPKIDNCQKVSEFKLIDGTVISDQNSLYQKGTVKICKGDCIAGMMPVDAFYSNTDDPPKKLAKK